MADNKNWKENWSKLDGVKFLIRESKKRTKGLGWIKMSFDAVNCLFKYGATFHDYMNLRFYIRSKKERKTFITTQMVKAEKKTWSKEAINQVDNKGLFNETFRDFVGREWIDMDTATEEEFINFVKDKKTFFVKPKRESSGIGIKKITVSEIPDLKEYYKENKGNGALVEETLISCDEMIEVNPYSTSFARIVTVYNEGKVHILAATLRSGEKKQVAFNTAKDDMFSQIDIKTGVCFTDAVDETGKVFEKHPVSGITFKGLQIPNWEIAKKTCIEAAKRVPEVRVIGWDVALTKDGCAFFEGNPGSGVASMQIADGIGKKYLFYKYLGKIPKKTTADNKEKNEKNA